MKRKPLTFSPRVQSLIAGLMALGSANAVPTVFNGGDLYNGANWTDGLPSASLDLEGIVEVNGTANGNQVNPWASGATVTIGGDAVLTLNTDFSAFGAQITVENATINCGDDFFAQGGTVTLNPGSTTTAVDDWEANNGVGRILVYGGTHSSGTGTGNNVGAQGNTTKIGCGIEFYGGTVTAGNFRFETNSDSIVGGSAVLASHSASTTFSDATGAINILSDWTGSWEVGSFGPGDWEALLTDSANGFTYDGNLIDAALFASTFVVTSNKVLTLASAAPSSFNGGDMLNAADWTNGLPEDPTSGFSAVDGTLTNSAGLSDWLLTVTGGTITATQSWSFTGASEIAFQSGTLNVTNDILSGDTSTMTFDAGTVTWGGSFAPAGSPGGTILINDGSFTGTADVNTTFGNIAGGTVTINGGTITASNFDFSAGAVTTIDGDAVLSGTSATFGVCDIQPGWSGTFTVTGFSGSDWETQFTTGNLTLGGNPVDAAAFAANFAISPDGQMLSYDPSTTFLGGDLLVAENWDNGLPAGKTATIGVDGSYGPAITQADPWLAGSTVTIGGGAVLTLDVDFAAGGAEVTVNDATINCSDDFFVQGGNVVLNDGSVTTAGDAWEANNSVGRITVNGGTHSSGTGINNNLGAQGSATKIGSGIDFRGGTVTAGNFRFEINSVSSVGGSAVLASHSSETTFSDMSGAIDILSSWTGTWTVGSFSGSDWEFALTGFNGFTLDGNPIDLATFESNFSVTDGGQTLRIGSGGTPTQPMLVVVGFNGSGEFLIQASQLDTDASYTLTRGTDLISFPDQVGSVVTGVSEFLFTDTTPPAGKAFYQLDNE